MQWETEALEQEVVCMDAQLNSSCLSAHCSNSSLRRLNCYARRLDARRTQLRRELETQCRLLAVNKVIPNVVREFQISALSVGIHLYIARWKAFLQADSC